MKILVISPTYNEKKSIANLINQILQLPFPIEILIVDDNSPDGTAELVKTIMLEYKQVHLLIREKKLGLGTAYCLGFNWAIENNYDIIIQMDADLSHNPADIELMLKKIESSDLIIGSRYVSGVNVVNWPIRRLLLSYFANWYARFIIRIPISDLTGGYKCFRRKVLESIDLSKINSEGYSFQIEMNFIAWKMGFKIIEIPIVFTDRTVGESKMNRSIVIEAIWIIHKLLINNIFNKF